MRSVASAAITGMRSLPTSGATFGVYTEDAHFTASSPPTTAGRDPAVYDWRVKQGLGRRAWLHQLSVRGLQVPIPLRPPISLSLRCKRREGAAHASAHHHPLAKDATAFVRGTLAVQPTGASSICSKAARQSQSHVATTPRNMAISSGREGIPGDGWEPWHW